MPIELTPTHRCKFKVNGGWRGGEMLLTDAWGTVVIDKLTGKVWSLAREEVLNIQPLTAKRNEGGTVK